MKQVLSLLLAYVFMHAQTWALSGGPVYNNGATFPDSLIGTYAAVMIPAGGVTGATNVAQSGGIASPAAIGVFTISVYEAGIAVGSSIVFVNGTAFVGQVGGLADADKQTINGLIAGTSTFDVIETVLTGITTTQTPPVPPATQPTITTNETFQQQNYPIFSQGKFETNVVLGDAGAFNTAPAGSGSNGTSGSTTSSTSTTPTSLEVGDTNAARLEGKASIGTFFLIDTNTGTPIITQTVNYSIDGLKQTNVPTNVTNLGISFSGNTGT